MVGWSDAPYGGPGAPACEAVRADPAPSHSLSRGLTASNLTDDGQRHNPKLHCRNRRRLTATTGPEEVAPEVAPARRARSGRNRTADPASRRWHWGVSARCADSARASPSRSGWSRSVPRSRAADQHVHDDALAQLYSGRAAACDGTTLQGVPHDRIVRAARSMHADLVVFGTHGRTGLGRLFLGSVASRVVTLALCPVRTVRGQ
jgi:nucleotide-binding universal stress UspA family protein